MNKKTQLLCTFTRKNRIDETIEDINTTYNISFNKIFILENKENNRELLCTYNIESEKIEGQTLKNTISIHRKKHTNTLYTINALNAVVMLNNGEMDIDYEVDWNKYRNMLLVTDDEGMVKEIKTKIFKIVEI